MLWYILQENGEIFSTYFMARASVQQVQESSVLQVVTLLWNASILVLQSVATAESMVTSPQAAPMLVLQFFRV